MNRFGLVLASGVALFAVLAGDARANDSTANQTSGGLVLSRTDAIAMRSEELRISRERIGVRYEFQNITEKDVTLTVAFPLPDVEPDFFNSQSDRNILGEEFETTVDGVSIDLQAERKALFNGRDVTAKLAALGLSPDPQITLDELEKMPRAEAQNITENLVRQGLMKMLTDLPSFGPMEGERQPQWTYRRRLSRAGLSGRKDNGGDLSLQTLGRWRGQHAERNSRQ